MTEDRKVIKRFESFVLGFCKCGCNKQMPLKSRTGHYLNRYIHGHNAVGKTNYFYKDGRSKKPRKNPYLKTYINNHPFRSACNRVYNHRLSLEQYYSEKFGIPIYILPYFDVHHIDHNTRNNHWSNLIMIPRRQHHIDHGKEMYSKK